MAFVKGQNPNHPPVGSTIKVEPIRDKKAIKRIKTLLADRPRDACLFTLSINTAYRANELLSLTVAQVSGLQVGDVLDIKQRKTRKYRPVTLNRKAIEAIGLLLESRAFEDNEPLFNGQRGPLTTSTVSTMVKTWCQYVGLKGNYGSHTLRKTWGYWQRMERGTAVPLLMEAFGHATQQQTLSYLGIQADEIAEIYELEL
ncbi:MAG: tyrosine-type recombinase/integrase [Elainellaceae cyanobacterium]